MSVYVQTNQPVLLPDAAANISSADTGKLMIINTVNGARTYTLPAVAPGLHYHFVNKAPAALGANVTLDCGVGLVNGILSIVGATPVAVTANQNIRFLTAATVKGDSVDLYCDGTNWSVFGASSVVGGLDAT